VGTTGKKKQETRKRILDVSREYFANNGYKETVIADVARDCNVDRRTIYRYFPSKEGVLIQLTIALFEEFTEASDLITYEGCETPLSKVQRLIDFYFDYIKEKPRFVQFLGMVDVFIGKSSHLFEEFRQLNQHGKNMDKRLSEIIAKGQMDGTIRNGYTSDEYAATINNSLIALATRTAIYQPDTINKHDGLAWRLMEIQGKLLIDTLRVCND